MSTKSGNTTAIVTSKVDLHQSVSRPVCLPSAETVALHAKFMGFLFPFQYENRFREEVLP